MKKTVISFLYFFTNILIKLFKESPSLLSMIFTFFSKVYSDKNNKISFNAQHNIYVHQNNIQVFYLEETPKWNISYTKLLGNVLDFHCQFYKPKQGDTIVEVGAGIGTESIVLSNLIGSSGMLYAFEAHPETFQKLKLLFSLNDIQNAKLFQKAIADTNEPIFIGSAENHATNKLTKQGGLKIDAITMDSFIESENITQIDFLKVNIEGAELEMIKGMLKSVGIVHNIAISCHDFLFDNSLSEIRDTIINFFESNGFQIHPYRSEHPARNSWVFGTRNENITTNR